MNNFKKQVLTSTKWAVLNQIVTQVIRLGVSIYMMRLLEPENFGVFIKALAIVGVSETIIGFRLGGGIIQASNIQSDQLSLINKITIIGAALLAIIIFISAETIADFYQDARIVDILRVCCIAILFLGIGYVPFNLLNKNLNFKNIFIANAIGISLSSIVGVWMALHDYGYWSLVWHWSIFSIATSILYLFLSKPNFYFVKSNGNLKNIWSFSSKILFDDILNYGTKNADNILVGKFLGSTELGYYSRAYNLMLLPIQNFINIIRGILFPAFSKIKGEKERLKNIFFQATQATSFFLLPLFLFSIIFTNEVIFYILGEKWLPINFILRIFLVLSIIQTHTGLISSVYLSQGRSDLMLKFGYITRPLLLVVIILSVNFGINTLVIAVVVANILISIVFLGIGLSLLDTSILTLVKKLKPVFFINTIIYGSLFVVQSNFQEQKIVSLQVVLIAFFTSIIIYFTYFEITRFPFYKEIRTQILKLKK